MSKGGYVNISRERLKTVVDGKVYDHDFGQCHGCHKPIKNHGHLINISDFFPKARASEKDDIYLNTCDKCYKEINKYVKSKDFKKSLLFNYGWLE